MATPTHDDVLRALSSINEPIFKRPLLELGLLTDLLVKNDAVTFRVQISSPAESVKQEIARNVKEVLKPLGVNQLEIAWDLQIPMRQTASEDPLPHVRNIILVMSGKGGVGKSTCAANIALALARDGALVGLLDTDIYGPSVPTMFGVSRPPTSADGKLIDPIEQHGIKLMSIGFMLEDPKSAIVWRGPMLHSALHQFLNDVNWGHLDYLVLDLPPGTGDVALTLAQRIKVTGALIVTTPQEVALQDVYKSVSMCKKLNIGVLGVVENMSYFIDTAGVKHELFGSGGGAKVAEFAEVPLLGQIPIDPLVREWGDNGTPVVKAAPGSPVGEAFTHVADALTKRVAEQLFAVSGGEKAPPTEGPTRLKIIR